MVFVEGNVVNPAATTVAHMFLQRELCEGRRTTRWIYHDLAEPQVS